MFSTRRIILFDETESSEFAATPLINKSSHYPGSGIGLARHLASPPRTIRGRHKHHSLLDLLETRHGRRQSRSTTETPATQRCLLAVEPGQRTAPSASLCGMHRKTHNRVRGPTPSVGELLWPELVGTHRRRRAQAESAVQDVRVACRYKLVCRATASVLP